MVPACGMAGVGLLGALRPEQQEVLPVYAGVITFELVGTDSGSASVFGGGGGERFGGGGGERFGGGGGDFFCTDAVFTEGVAVFFTVVGVLAAKNSVGVLIEVDALLCFVDCVEMACCTDASSALALALMCCAYACASGLFLV